MDPALSAAIIGAIGAIVAAVLGVVLSRRKRKSEVLPAEDAARKANTLRIGFESGMLDYLEALRTCNMWSDAGDEGVAIQVQKIQALARALGITNLPQESRSILESLSDYFLKAPLSLRRTYDIGFNIASGFGTGIIMQVAAVRGRRKEVEQQALNTLKKTKSVLEDAGLRKGFLSSVARQWKDFARNIDDGSHDIGAMTSTMKKCVEELSLEIERAK